MRNSWIWFQHYQKNVFWPYFRGLYQNVSPLCILSLHIRNAHECVADEFVHSPRKVFVQIDSRFLINHVLIFQKLIHFNTKDINRIYLIDRRNIFKTTIKWFPDHVWEKTDHQSYCIFSNFHKIIISIKFLLGLKLLTTTPLNSNLTTK